MKLMPCPLNGLRNISEFIYGGEVKTMPNPQTCSDQAWADYVFYADNTAGVVSEWWMHSASAYWFIAKRNTLSDEVIETFDPGLLFRERQAFTAPPAEEPK